MVVTPFGAFDTTPSPGQPIIPRNCGRGPAFFTTWLGVSKTFSFGAAERNAAAASGGKFDNGGSKFGGGGEGRYNLSFSVNVQNLFNQTNEGTPIGDLGSPLFGLANSTAGGFGFGSGGGGKPAGNRRIDFQIRLGF